jgi:glycolate oxidase FAD binding subunit
MDAKVSSKVNPSTFEADVREIVGATFVRTATAADAVAGVQAGFVVEPGNEKELAKVLKVANAAGMAVIPRGGGTKLEWGNRPERADVILSLARMNRVIAHAWADLTVNVEAGCTIGKLQETLAKHGQQLALDALWAERATVGGVLSTNDSGVLRLRFGSLRDLVIGVTLALADGTVASSGGRVVKNVAGYDLPKLVTGALGTLGVITSAFFRLHPLPRERRTISWSMGDLRAAQKAVMAIQNSKLAHSGLQIFCGEGKTRVDVLLEGTEAGLSAQVEMVKGIVGAGEMGDGEVWVAREEICSTGEGDVAVVKFAILPGLVAETLESVAGISAGLWWSAVVQGTGIGWMRMEGPVGLMGAALKKFRARIEEGGGSVVVLRRAVGMGDMEAWGEAGDAVGLMRAVKGQFDPRGILNPGRFVGRI